MSPNPTIGFDRRIRREWLDLIAARRASGKRLPDLRKLGHRLLRKEYPGDVARAKTLTVIFHLWVDVPGTAVSLRDSATGLLPKVDPQLSVAFHWGLSLATYPFFRDVADHAGRLLRLQGSASLAQIQRRLSEKWGQRSTAERAAQRIIRSWIDWGMLRESSQRGTYVAAEPLSLSGPLASWLVEALLTGAQAETHVVARVNNAPALFPFDVRISAHELRRDPHLAVHRPGVDEDVVMLRQPNGRDVGAQRKQLSLL